jgi:hypothetical protein
METTEVVFASQTVSVTFNRENFPRASIIRFWIAIKNTSNCDQKERILHITFPNPGEIDNVLISVEQEILGVGNSHEFCIFPPLPHYSYSIHHLSCKEVEIHIYPSETDETVHYQLKGFLCLDKSVTPLTPILLRELFSGSTTNKNNRRKDPEYGSFKKGASLEGPGFYENRNSQWKCYKLKPNDLSDVVATIKTHILAFANSGGGVLAFGIEMWSIFYLCQIFRIRRLKTAA